MQIGVDVTCMYTIFGGRDPSSFGDTATFENGTIKVNYKAISPDIWSGEMAMLALEDHFCSNLIERIFSLLYKLNILYVINTTKYSMFLPASI